MDRGTMINPNDEIQFVIDLIDDYAAADGRLAALESYKSALKALKMKDSTQTSVAGKEMDAFASDEYIQFCEEIEQARVRYTSLKLKIETAKMKVEVWRTEQATNRQIEKLTR
jgi:hypothetical protein